jgi:hypothetical protein
MDRARSPSSEGMRPGFALLSIAKLYFQRISDLKKNGHLGSLAHAVFLAGDYLTMVIQDRPDRGLKALKELMAAQAKRSAKTPLAGLSVVPKRHVHN